MPKSLKEVQDFMDRERLASFVTIDLTGEPHVVPVFFVYEKGKTYVQTARRSVKVRNLLGNGKAAVAVYSGEEAVIIRGNARIINTNEEFVERTKGHINKYKLKLNGEGRDMLGIPLFDGRIRCVVEVTPKKILFW